MSFTDDGCPVWVSALAELLQSSPSPHRAVHKAWCGFSILLLHPCRASSVPPRAVGFVPGEVCGAGQEQQLPRAARGGCHPLQPSRSTAVSAEPPCVLYGVAAWRASFSGLDHAVKQDV